MMMRWGSKKKASSSSSASSSSFSSSSSTYIHSVSRVLSFPWLLKFKRVSNGLDLEARKEWGNGKLNSGSEKFKSFGSRETRLVCDQGYEDLKKRRSVVRENTEDLLDVRSCESGNGVVIKTPRLPVQNDQILKRSMVARREKSSQKSPGAERKTISMILEEKRDSKRNGSRKENRVLETPRENSASPSAELEGNCKISQQEQKLEWQIYREKKMKEVKEKSEENRRKSLYISSEIKGGRSKQKQRFKSNSPKVEFCRIKALNNMKKAKLRIKTHEERQTAGLGSRPVVKYSPDPQKDFKDSMVEMIAQKRIWQPAELEELLACYLTLNSVEYHDMILNVFQQVWLSLNKYHLALGD